MGGITPDPAPVLGLLNAFRSSQALFAAVDLAIFEILKTSNSPLSLQLICEGVACRRGQRVSEDGLDRLCRTCVALGLLETPSPGLYSLTPLAENYLVTSSSTSLVGYCTHSARVVWPLFGGLSSAVASGSQVWQQIFGQPGSDVFARIYSTPADVLRFLSGMHSFATLSAPSVVTAFDLSFATSLVDLGGATGAIARSACESYPGLHSAVVVDLPHVVADARANFAPPPGGPCDGRLSWLAADFFTEQDNQVDVVVLSRILHDWDLPRCQQLLALSHRLLRPGGALLVAEMLLESDRMGPLPVLLQDLNMLCQTHGRERSAAEYEELLGAAGFVDVKARKTGSYLDAVLARKP
ncbi:hypothetical protein VOLCADRAFT_60120 [Volvox carteri f. nagariensis]|uniref:O-methyltransferase domain-containing protein n=1 Tax=Volvox carteri f. nagariensis TaxID=3068 RepID=D8TUS0_VOLCA|nr:uncharacterized protein VOLCADRAFT_60120 [Volvox carteri f. nagariensis]EFJ48756.1 hypothetical protein VOLCADRAFT_60120 [Volvox carteri f. nagariensis]|eukprot:XP_002950088.1 hypothetical protein VOLCADRAFT_60120 [Volvox carteri f. nagariensis]